MPGTQGPKKLEKIKPHNTKIREYVADRCSNDMNHGFIYITTLIFKCSMICMVYFRSNLVYIYFLFRPIALIPRPFHRFHRSKKYVGAR